MFYIVALTARIPEIMIHNKKQTVKITLWYWTWRQ
jgi:hypothetical protein